MTGGKEKIRGFTLVELAVVVGAVAISASILLPAMSRNRQEAKRIACQSNLKELGFICRMYTNDNNGKFWQAWYSSTPYDHRWMDCVRPYCNDTRLYFCPVAKVPVMAKNQSPINAQISIIIGIKPSDAWGRFHDADTRPGYAGMAGSYGVNCWIEDPFATPTGQASSYYGPNEKYWIRPLGKGASQVPVFLDARWLGGFAGRNTTGTSAYGDAPPAREEDIPVQTSQMQRYCVNRHQGNVNSVFLDISTRSVGLKELWTLKWHQQYEVKNTVTKSTYNWAGNAPWMKDFKDYSNW